MSSGKKRKTRVERGGLEPLRHGNVNSNQRFNIASVVVWPTEDPELFWCGNSLDDLEPGPAVTLGNVKKKTVN